VFTNWIFVRIGQLDWADAGGKSIYQGKVKAGPWDANFRAFLSPHGIRLVAESAQRSAQSVIQIERPWETMGISVRTLLLDDGKYRLWAMCHDADNNSHWEYFDSKDGKSWNRP